MRSFLPAVLLTALLPTLAFAAQDDDADDLSPPPHARMQDGRHGSDAMLRGLKLTPDQREDIGELVGKERHQERKIVQGYLEKLPEAQRKALEEELKVNREQTRQAIRTTLKPEQQKRFDEEMKKREAQQKEWAEFQQWKKDHKSS